MPKVGQVFNPYRTFTGIFIPDGLCRSRDVPNGSKIVYGRLARYAGESGEAFPSVRTMADEIGMSERQCWRYLAKLVQAGFLKVEQRPGDTSVYQFLWHSCFEDTSAPGVRLSPSGGGNPRSSAGSGATSDTGGSATCVTGGGAGGSATSDTGGSATSDTTPNHNSYIDIYSSLRESEEESHVPPIAPPQENSHLEKTSDQPEHSRQAVADVDLETPVVQFLVHAWKRERRVRLKLHRACDTRTVERIRDLERRMGKESFRRAALAYLAEDSEYLREKGWPLALFLKQAEQSDEGGTWNRPRRASGGHHSIGKAGVVPDTPPSAPIDPSASNGQIPYAAQRWNEVVTLGEPVERWTRRDRGRPDDPEFLNELEKILALCQKIHEAQGDEAKWLTFHWLLKTSKDGVENWYRILTEGRAWARIRRSDTKPKVSAGTDALAKYLSSVEDSDGEGESESA